MNIEINYVYLYFSTSPTCRSPTGSGFVWNCSAPINDCLRGSKTKWRWMWQYDRTVLCPACLVVWWWLTRQLSAATSLFPWPARSTWIDFLHLQLKGRKIMELEVSHTVLSEVKTKRIKKGEHFNWLGQVIRLGDN